MFLIREAFHIYLFLIIIIDGAQDELLFLELTLISRNQIQITF